MKFKIFTDSTADISPEVANKLGITVVPLDVIFSGEVYKANELTNEDFYAKLNDCIDNGKPLPTTSQVKPEAFEEAFKPYSNIEDTFVGVLTIAKEMSATYYSAQKAIENLGMKNVVLFDTLVTTFALGALVCEIAKAAQQPNMTVEKFIEIGNDLNKRVWLYVSLGNLRCLRAGGRLSASSMLLGSMLKVKPIACIEKKVEVCAKCLGQAKATRYIVDHVNAERDPELPLYFGSSLSPEMVEAIRKEYGAKLNLTGNEEEFTMGPVVGTHAGPGCVGIAFFKKK